MYQGVNDMTDNEIAEMTEVVCGRKMPSVSWKRIRGGRSAFVTCRTPQEAQEVIDKVQWIPNPKDNKRYVNTMLAWYKPKHHWDEKPK